MQPRKRKVPTKGSRSVANRHEDPRFARLCDEWFVVTGSRSPSGAMTRSISCSVNGAFGRCRSASLLGESVEFDAPHAARTQGHTRHAPGRIAHELERSAPGGERARHRRVELARNVHQLGRSRA